MTCRFCNKLGTDTASGFLEDKADGLRSSSLLYMRPCSESSAWPHCLPGLPTVPSPVKADLLEGVYVTREEGEGADSALKAAQETPSSFWVYLWLSTYHLGRWARVGDEWSLLITISIAFLSPATASCAASLCHSLSALQPDMSKEPGLQWPGQKANILLHSSQREPVEENVWERKGGKGPQGHLPSTPSASHCNPGSASDRKEPGLHSQFFKPTLQMNQYRLMCREGGSVCVVWFNVWQLQSESNFSLARLWRLKCHWFWFIPQR